MVAAMDLISSHTRTFAYTFFHSAPLQVLLCVFCSHRNVVICISFHCRELHCARTMLQRCVKLHNNVKCNAGSWLISAIKKYAVIKTAPRCRSLIQLLSRFWFLTKRNKLKLLHQLERRWLIVSTTPVNAEACYLQSCNSKSANDQRWKWY